MSPKHSAELFPGASSAEVRRYDGKQSLYECAVDMLAQEVPVAFEYNGISHATLLASPCDLEDLALGFSLTEGILRTSADLHDVEIVETPQGMIARMIIASACFAQLKQRRRTLAGRTGCGLCGVENLEDVVRPLPPVSPPRSSVNAAAICRAAGQLRALQPLHRETGATHAAAWADMSGSLIHVREDVGRHNAMDKLIGLILHRRRQADTSAGFAVISSRASFEIVQKAAAAGMACVAAVSAPTHYAVQLADELGVMLIGFTRGETFTVYSHPEYLG